MADSLKTKLAPFTVTKGKDFKLKDHPTDPQALEALEEGDPEAA